jgi:hypothetical protein
MTRNALWVIVGIVLTLAFVTIAPTVGADQGNQSTQLTFNQRVEIPGHIILPAGTYWFVVPDYGFATPDFVQILNAGRTRIIATVEAVPNLRRTATSDSEFTFAEQSRRQPIALISWFYPGTLTGHEFVYPHREELKLAGNEQITLTAHAAGQG